MLGLRLNFVLNRAALERAVCFAAFYSTMVKQAAGEHVSKPTAGAAASHTQAWPCPS